jgi:hypothetical protein
MLVDRLSRSDHVIDGMGLGLFEQNYNLVNFLVHGNWQCNLELDLVKNNR